MAGNKTVIEAVMDIVESLGGSGDPKTVVEALELLGDQIGEGGLSQYVAEYLTDNPDIVTDIVTSYLTEHGADLTYTLTGERLDITLT